MAESKVMVIGASNLDMVGRSKTVFTLKTSNPGIAELVVGGVGRNIYECLQRVGIKSATLVSFVGDDSAGQWILSDFEAKKLVTNSFCLA